MADPLDNFSPPVAQWFRGAFGQPTAPQAAGWPPIQRGEHTLILAPTGSGKTLAAFLWSIDEIYRELAEDRDRAGVRLLYVSPLKALNNDIERNLRAPLAGIRATAEALRQPLPPLHVSVRTGDTPAAARQAMVRKPPHILITTPESLYLILSSPRARDMLKTVRTVIVDEIYTLVGEKRGVHLTLSLERLEHLAGRRIQRIGLSATVRPLEEAARFLGGQTFDALPDGESTSAAGTPRSGEAEAAPTPRPVTIVDTGYRKPLDLEVVTPVEDFRNLPGTTIWPTAIPQVLGDVMRHRSTLIFANNRRLAERTADRLNAQIAAERSEEIPPGSTEALAPGGIARDRGMFAIGAEGPIRAHHGSMSREARREMEEDLKAGRLPALVSTGTLELGIDIGMVDLVVQLQSPKSVSQGLQRVGRSGHMVGQTSRGRIYATHREDLVEAAAVAAGMRAGDVEETTTPRNALDVLAQQVLASVSVEPWDADALYRLVRQAYPYADLTPRAWESVLAMLSGRFQGVSGVGHPSLRPRIAWDRINNGLATLPGTRLLALNNPGTIPDTGAYDVYLADGKTRVGTLDEEFIFETRPGDTFLLGSNVWRVMAIENDRVVVSDAAGHLPRMPFWHGDYPWRPYELGVRIGRLRREVATQVRLYQNEPEKVIAWLREAYLLDRNSAVNLHDYVNRQLDALGGISSDEEIIIETFADAVGEARAVVHSPFGGRINGAWALALADALRERTGIDIETQVNDDGILLRFPGAALSELSAAPDIATEAESLHALREAAGEREVTPPGIISPAHIIRRMGVDEARRRILRELPNSAVFGARFRMNAARALLLPRSRGRRRTPFWLQRLKARDLLAAVRNQPDFPIIAETYRDCLRDVLDLEHLNEVLQGIEEGRIRVTAVETATPSPLAAGLLYAFASVYLYEWDTPKAERQLQELALSRELVDDLLAGAGSGRLPLRPEAVAEVTDGTARPARTADELAVLLLQMGDLTAAEVAARAGEDAVPWLAELAAAGRVVELDLRTAHGSERRWVAAELAGEYAGLLADASAGETDAAEGLTTVLQRYLRSAGPVTREEILDRYGFREDWLTTKLDRLVAARELVRGRFAPDRSAGDQYCDRGLFERLYRRTLTLLRREVAPVPLEVFAAFLLRWQGTGPAQRTEPDATAAAVGQLRGLALPMAVWERDVLPARAVRYHQSALDALLRSGERAWICAGGDAKRAGGAAQRANVRFVGRGEGGLFLRDFPVTLPDAGLADPADRAAAAIYGYLKAEGASFVADLAAGLGLSPAALRGGLTRLALAGLVTGDSLAALAAVLGETGAPRERQANDRLASGLAAELAARRPGRGGRRMARPTRESLYAAQRRVEARLAPDEPREDEGWSGRWSLVSRAAVFGPPRSAEDRAAALAPLLLARYGVLTSELVARSESAWAWLGGGEESPAIPQPAEAALDWSPLYMQLQRMELRGEVRRGYFVQGLSGVQFALPEAVEGLRASRDTLDGDESVTCLVSLDPANLYGGEAGGIGRGQGDPSTGGDRKLDGRSFAAHGSWGPSTGGDSLGAVSRTPAQDASTNPDLYRFARVPSTHVVLWRGVPVLVAEDSGARLTAAGVEEEVLRAALRAYLQRPGAPKRTSVSTWNGADVLGSAGEPLLRGLGGSRTPAGIDVWLEA